jgi:MATE family multidrug resistance protein
MLKIMQHEEAPMQKNIHRESFTEILAYWLPDFITVLLIVALPPLFDSYFIASYKSTAMFGAIGMAANFIHIIIKFSESIPVAAIALIGRANGAGDHKTAGEKFASALWCSLSLATIQLIFLMTCAHHIYAWLGVPADMAALGAPFLRLRSIDIFISFIVWTMFGFMRALKNTKTPMIITLSGSITYLIMASIFIPGRGFIPGLGLYGAALAAFTQSIIMFAVALYFLCTDEQYKPYLAHFSLFRWSWDDIQKIFSLSIPVVIDKTSLAFTYVWLSKMIAPAGALAIASFDIIKNLERTAFMPASAFAVVLTFLVSNHLGRGDADGAHSAMRKTLLLTLAFAGLTLGALSLFAEFFVGKVAPSGDVVAFTAPLLRVLNIVAIFDYIQLIFASTLRGAGSVRTVMWTRAASCLLFFLPISYILSHCSFSSPSIKVGMIYGAFFVNAAVMSAVFFWYITRSRWHQAN